jgi:DNA alkylation damage repair protein AlkB
MRWLAPGACSLPAILSIDEQRGLADRCRGLVEADAGAYVPTVRGGGRMRVRMLCLGKHWNPLTYRYEAARTDFDGKPVPDLPEDLADLGRRVAAAAGYDLNPDICLINWYGADGRMGLHQDKDESPGSLERGVPVVSLSVGDTARFLFGGLRRRDPVESLMLQSGDGFVFGGPARLRYHGVARILPGTAPQELMAIGRINLTFRRF